MTLRTVQENIFLHFIQQYSW